MKTLNADSSTATLNDPIALAKADAQRFRDVFSQIHTEVHKVFVGHDDLVTDVLSVLLAGGHVLIEGLPGLGKTLLAHTLAQTLSLAFSRIQFTPDLMPTDILGTHVLSKGSDGTPIFRLAKGPIVANFILADEINRATPKTQSAMLQAMQEHHISIGRRTIALPDPFIVIATQNPIEHEGTYPLPEAQLDRFMVKLLVGYPKEDEYHAILRRTTGTHAAPIDAVATAEDIVHLRRVVRSVAASDQVTQYVAKLVIATQPNSSYAPPIVLTNVAVGSSPRGAQALLLLAKARALLDGRFAASCEDVRRVAHSVLRHRIILNYHGHSTHTHVDTVIDQIIAAVRESTT